MCRHMKAVVEVSKILINNDYTLWRTHHCLLRQYANVIEEKQMIENRLFLCRQITSYRMRREICSRSVTRTQSPREEPHGAPSPTSKKKKNTKKVSPKITLIWPLLNGTRLRSRMSWMHFANKFWVFWLRRWFLALQIRKTSWKPKFFTWKWKVTTSDTTVNSNQATSK